MHTRWKRSCKCPVKRGEKKTPSEAFFPSTLSDTHEFAAFCRSKQRQSSSNAALQPTIPIQQHNQLQLQSKHTQLFVSLSSLISNAPYGEHGGATMHHTKRCRARSLLITLQSDGDFQGLSDPLWYLFFFFF